MRADYKSARTKEGESTRGKSARTKEHERRSTNEETKGNPHGRRDIVSLFFILIPAAANSSFFILHSSFLNIIFAKLYTE